MKRQRSKPRHYKDAEQIQKELEEIYFRPSCKGKWTGEQRIAFDLSEVLGIARAMAADFLEDPTIKGWQKTKSWLVDDHHFYSLKNFNPKSKREADRLAKESPRWLKLVPLEEVADRLKRLEEDGS